MKNKTSDTILLKNDVRPHTALFMADTISAILILLFLYTALSKLWDYEHFKSVLFMSPLLRPISSVIAWFLPLVEIIIVLLLFFSQTREKGLIGTGVIMILFTAYIFYMVVFTPRLPCSCGGVLKSLTWTQHIFFNLFILLLTGVAMWLYRKIKKQILIVPP